MHHEWICILDFGSQYTQLIARRVREQNVYCEILPFHVGWERVVANPPKGIILSGGPSSVYDEGAPTIPGELFSSGIPVLGICYGLQLLALHHGAGVEPASRREFGKAGLNIVETDPLFASVRDGSVVWMSHGDALTSLPEGFRVIARTDNAPFGAIRHQVRPLYGVQFHPEVVHSEQGKDMLRNFLFSVCDCRGDWNSRTFIEEATDRIRTQVGTDHVICGLSGGVDSAVAAVLLHRALGDQVHCIHIDNGVMRRNESREVVDLFERDLRIPVTLVDASALFLERLAGVTDPEKKRKIIGAAFIDAFEQEIAAHRNAAWLAQGTLYPDVIESVSFKGPSATIKSHHNVGGLPDTMRLKLLEPFRELFKDEVRAVGRELGIPEHFIGRHPFPGPGLAIRVLGEVTEEALELLRTCDDIYIDEIRRAGLYDEIWQAFCVLLPVRSVGVMGDARTYENTIAVRAVTSTDGMTADWARIPYDVLASISNRIINEVRGVNRVVYDISSKPPATIEWE